jgi:hypothetical protein
MRGRAGFCCQGGNGAGPTNFNASQFGLDGSGNNVIKANAPLTNAVLKTATITAPVMTDGESSGLVFTVAGMVNDGTTDNTTVLSSFIAAVPTGSTVLIKKPGTYVLDTVVVNKRIRLEGDQSVVLKAKANATGSLFFFNVPPIGVKGFTFDGNQANQNANTTNWWSLVRINAQLTNIFQSTIEDCVFTNYVRANTYLENAGTYVVKNCKFYNGREHPSVAGLTTASIIFENNSGVMHGTAAELRVTGCDFFQNNLPGTLSSTDSTAPGGILVVAGESIGSTVNDIWVDFTASGNTFRMMGQNRSANTIASIHLYQGVRDAVITQNRFIDCLYVPVSLQNAGNLTVTENKFYTTPAASAVNQATVIWVNPNQRNDNAKAVNFTDVSHNTINGYPGNRAIWFLGSNASGYELKAIANTITNARSGIFIENWEGPATVALNHIDVKNGTESTVTLINTTNALRLSLLGNWLTSSNVTGVSLSGTNVTVNARGNWFETDGSGWTAMVARGLKRAFFTDNRFNGLNSATAANVQQDGSGNHVGTLEWALDNIILAGSKSFNFAQIDNVLGTVSYTGTPEGAVTAPVGTVYIRTDGGSGTTLYIKESGTGKHRMGWAWSRGRWRR